MNRKESIIRSKSYLLNPLTKKQFPRVILNSYEVDLDNNYRLRIFVCTTI